MFEVQPWEVAKKPYEFEFHSVQLVRWGGKEWEVALKQLPGHNRRLYFRVVGGLLLTDNRIYKPHGRESGEVLMKRMFLECLDEARWERELYLNWQFELRAEEDEEQAGYSLSIAPDGSGYFGLEEYPRPHLLRRDVSFGWTASDVLRQSAQQLMAYLENEQDYRFARAFICMSDDERLQQMFQWKRGDHHELKQVVMWLLLSQEELWQQCTELRLTIDLMFTNFEWGTKLSSDQHPIKVKNDKGHPLPPSLRDSLQTIMAWFEPQLNAAQVEKHKCLDDLLGEGEWLIVVRFSNPSAHERIEAALKWREWLAEHGASA